MLLHAHTCRLPLRPPLNPARRGYQHFGGRGQQAYAVVHSREARTRALRVLAVVGAGGAVIWVSSRQEVPYTLRK